MVKTKCEVYSRVCGYLRPVNTWNEGKQEEWKDRKVFSKDSKEVKEMKKEHGQKDGSKKGKLAGGLRQNQTDDCRNPEVKAEREQEE